jgi:hypothetical protein
MGRMTQINSVCVTTSCRCLALQDARALFAGEEREPLTLDSALY